MTDRIKLAIEYATECHGEQKRKYTGEDYIEHPKAVAKMFEEEFIFPPLMLEDGIIAALLHDVVEDTQATYDDIMKYFGDTVASYVWFLTDADGFVGSRKLRKTLTIERLKCAPDVVKAIKLCDLMHNSVSIKEQDPKFWSTYKKEAWKLVEVDGGAGLTRVAAQYSHLTFFLHEYSEFIESISDPLTWDAK